MTRKISPNREGSIVRTVAFRQFVFLIVAVSFLCSVAAAQTTGTMSLASAEGGVVRTGSFTLTPGP